MTDIPDDILDNLFHGCAWAAYIDQMSEEENWPPDREATRRRAYRYYEQALAEKNRRPVVGDRREKRAAEDPEADERQEMGPANCRTQGRAL